MRSEGDEQTPPASLSSVPQRPLLPGFFRIVPMGEDCVQVRSAGRVLRLSVPGIGTFGPPLFAALDGGSSLAQLSERFSVPPATLRELVGRLARDSIVVDGGAEGGWPANGNLATGEFYDQLGEGGREASTALADALVVFMGLGPVARTAARHLAASGVGRLVLADAGPLTDLDQAMLPGAAVEGHPSRREVAAAECRLAARVPAGGDGSTRVLAELETDIASILCSGPVDLVVIEVDEPGVGAEAANAACLTAGVPALFHELSALEGIIGPTVLSSSSACYQCRVSRKLSHIRYHDEHLAYQRALRSGELTPRQPAVLGGCAGIMGGLLAIEATSLLSGSPRLATVNGVLVADFRTLEVRRESVLAVPGCPACRSFEQEIVLGP